ncbi:tail fiber assembly protein [Salmonella enterica]
MSFEMTGENRYITVHDFDPEVGEYTETWVNFYIPAWTGLPAHSTDIAPPEIIPGYAAVFDLGSESWSLAEDHRGKTVWHTVTQKSLVIAYLGPVREGFTLLEPGPYSKWDGNQWEHDNEAEKADQVKAAITLKESLMALAIGKIAILQDTVDLGMSTPEEEALLIEWKKYRVLLNRIDPNDVPDIEWPEEPH